MSVSTEGAIHCTLCFLKKDTTEKFNLSCIPETIDSYQFLQRRDNSVRAMRGGREYSVDSIDPFASLRERQKMLGDNFILNSLHDQVQAKKKSRVKRFSGHSNHWRRTQHVSFLAGIRILDPKRSSTKYSGYQVMRLATELIPSYSAILGESEFYFLLKISKF